MQPLRFPVDVVMERVPLANRWVEEMWRPLTIEPIAAGPVEAAAGHEIEPIGPDRWRLGGYWIELHPVEAEGYFLNLTAPAPCVFVMWRMYEEGEPPARPVVVTVSYNEAGRLLDAGERVDNVPLPAILLESMRSFVADHYKPEPRRKVKRNDPFASDRGEGKTNSRD